MNADLEAFVCRDFSGLVGLGDVSSSTGQYNTLLKRLQAAQARAESAGRVNDFALNFREANDALNSIRTVVNYWSSPSPATCLVEQRGNYVEAFRSSTPMCRTFLADSAYEQVIGQQAQRFNTAIVPVEQALGVAAPSGLLDTALQRLKDVFFEEETPPVTGAPKPAPSPGTVSLAQKLFGGKTVPDTTSVATTPAVGGALKFEYPDCSRFSFTGRQTPDPQLFAVDAGYQYCWARYLESQEFKNMLRQTPDAISTPQPGTTPVTITADSISKILAGITQGWTEIERARLQQAMLKAAARGQKAYVRRDQTEFQPGPSWGLIAGGAGLLILGGVLIYMLAKNRGRSAAPASMAAAVPSVPALAGAKK